MDTGYEKRAFKRNIFNRPFDFELSAVGEGLRENIHERAEALNISSGGIGLLSAHALKRGEILKLYLPAFAGSAALPVFSEVVWVRHTGGHVEAGLRFLG